MLNLEVIFLKKVFNPMLFLMSNAPDVEKNLEIIMSMLQATTESLKNIKSGIDNFHASVLKVASAMPNSSINQKQPVNAPEPAANAGYEGAVSDDPAPQIQMPPQTSPE
jgi:hypothetical protein